MLIKENVCVSNSDQTFNNTNAIFENKPVLKRQTVGICHIC